jgi:hypothetical protein
VVHDDTRRALIDAVPPFEDIAEAHRRLELGHRRGKLVLTEASMPSPPRWPLYPPGREGEINREAGRRGDEILIISRLPASPPPCDLSPSPSSFPGEYGSCAARRAGGEHGQRQRSLPVGERQEYPATG